MEAKAKQAYRGFTLIETLVTIAILLIVAMIIYPSFLRTFADIRLRGDVSAVEQVIRKTIAEGIARGTFTRLVVQNGTITGQISDDLSGVNFVSLVDLSGSEEYAFTLDEGTTFTRSEESETPWLKMTDQDSLPSLDGVAGQVTFTQFGLPDRGTAIFVQQEMTTAVIEILASGHIKIYHRKEGDTWTR